MLKCKINDISCLLLDALAFLLALQAKHSTLVWHTWTILIYINKANAAQIEIQLWFGPVIPLTISMG